MSCTSFLPDQPRFPLRVTNRPALPRIGYRVGGYGDLIASMHRYIDHSVVLSGWTHRDSDDPGIALLEGAAIVGDVLTFYQEHYANEAFLRTATWSESVQKLVRLLGHRPAPGLGGRTDFALEVRGDAAVEMPEAFPIKARLQDVDDPVDFLTTEALVAYPHLSRFHLYRRRIPRSTVAEGSREVDVHAVEGDRSTAARAGVGLRSGDRLALVAPEPAWVRSGTSASDEQPEVQFVDVSEVRTPLGRMTIRLGAPLVRDWTAPARAFRVGRTFRHAGHAAPPIHIRTVSTSGEISGAQEQTTDFRRHLDNHVCTLSDLDGGVYGDAIPLDRQVDDVVVGAEVLVRMTVQDGGTPRRLQVVRRVVGVETTSVTFAGTTAPSTVLRLDELLLPNAALDHFETDMRTVTVHELTSPRLGLGGPPDSDTHGFTTGLDALAYFGTLDEVRALAGRRLLFEREGHEPVERVVVDGPDHFELPAGADEAEARMWTLSFDRPPPFDRAAYDEDEPTVVVRGNVIRAEQGKDEGEVVLGSGDGRAGFQTFPIPAAPLTWHPSVGSTPPQDARLEVRVAGRLWRRVDSLFGRGPDDEIYIVRTADDGASWVQFGDGLTGARLPSGRQNVTARYRTGWGAFGSPDPTSRPTPGRRIDGLDKVLLPGSVSGGRAPEGPETARRAAPGRVQGMGRLVSLQDFETEVLGIGGVGSARAVWTTHEGTPALVLRILMRAGREQEFDDVRDTVRAWQRCRGPDRFPVVVRRARIRWGFLDLRCAFAPAEDESELRRRVRSELGPSEPDAGEGEGLFSASARAVGAPEYRHRVEARVQNVPGVLWCRAEGLGLFPAAVVDPDTVSLPSPPRPRAGVLAPGVDELIQIHPRHLVLSASAPPPTDECAP